jgi:hypothetical protein
MFKQRVKLDLSFICSRLYWSNMNTKIHSSNSFQFEHQIRKFIDFCYRLWEGEAGKKDTRDLRIMHWLYAYSTEKAIQLNISKNITRARTFETFPIWKFCGGKYVDCCGLPGCDAMWSCRWLPRLRESIFSVFRVIMKDEDGTFLRNVDNYLQDRTAYSPDDQNRKLFKYSKNLFFYDIHFPVINLSSVYYS